MTINNELLFQLRHDGKKCWHEPTDANNPFAESPCIHCGKILIHWPHGWFAEGENITPDYSRPADLYEFFAWLCRERREMWEGFTDWIDAKGERDLSIPAPWLWSKLIPWLFFQSPSRPRDLMAEWLRLDETVERWGISTCKVCDGTGEGEVKNCRYCNGSSKILAPWARYAKEGKGSLQ